MKFATRKKNSPLAIEMAERPTTYETRGRQLYALIKSEEKTAWHYSGEGGGDQRAELVNIIHQTGEIRWYVEPWRSPHCGDDAEAIRYFNLNN